MWVGFIQPSTIERSIVPDAVRQWTEGRLKTAGYMIPGHEPVPWGETEKH